MSEPRVFISHSSKDEKEATALVRFMTHVGIPEKAIRCSSAPETQVPTGCKIFEDIRAWLKSENVYVIFLLSDNYYDSYICLNEMGAAWLNDAVLNPVNETEPRWQLILLPGFPFERVKGVIESEARAGISLSDDELGRAKSRFFDVKKRLEKLFSISLNDATWERERDAFLESVHDYQFSQNKIWNMKKAKGMCITKFDHSGCRVVKKESSEDKTTAIIDYGRTDAELCSIIFRVEKNDWKTFFRLKKNLCFEIVCDVEEGESVPLKVELQMNGWDEQYEIIAESDIKTYKIPLVEFGDDKKLWEKVKETNFLFYRNKTPSKVKVTIENLRIE